MAIAAPYADCPDLDEITGKRALVDLDTVGDEQVGQFRLGPYLLRRQQGDDFGLPRGFRGCLCGGSSGLGRLC